MAAMIQSSPVALRGQQQQKETQDVTSNKHGGHGKIRFNQNQDGWTYPQDWQQQQQQQFVNNSYYYTYQQQYTPPLIYHSPQHRSHRPRTQSSPSNTSIQPQKSSSTPTSPHQHYKQRQQQQHQQRKQRPSPSSIISSSSSSSSSTNNNSETRRPKSMLMQQPPSSRPIPMPSNRPGSIVDSGRRSSVASNSSTVSQSVSIRSEMSLGTKASLSKRLRKVFSVSSLRSPSKGSLGSLDNSSNASLATIDMIPEENGAGFSPLSPSTPPQRSLRRRSLASLSTLFQRSAPSPSSPQPQPQPSFSNLRRPSAASAKNTVQPFDKKDRPTLRVDTTQPTVVSSPSSSTTTRKASFIVAPDSPNSSASTRSPITRPTGPHRLASELPSPTPSTSSSTSSSSAPDKNQQKPAAHKYDDDSQLADDFNDLAMAPPPVIGVHYGLPMHGSPRLKPAASSSSSSLIDQVTPLPGSKRRLQFCPTVQVHETFTAADYDRRCDTNATCQKLTPSLALKIKQEINEYKLTEMDVHLESRQYTQFFL